MTAPERTRAEALLQKFTRALCRLSLRIAVEGLERLPLEGPTVAVFNHLSVADGPLLVSFLPRKGVFMVAREFGRVPLLNWAITKVAAPIYVDRRARDRRPVLRARAVLEQGGLLCLAPEGRVSPTGALSKAHQGAAFIARAGAARLVPIALHGTEKFWRQWLRFRRPRVRIVVGEPFTLPSNQVSENTNVLMRKIADLLPPRYRGYYGIAHDADV